MTSFLGTQLTNVQIASQVTVMLITYNEAPNIDRCLARLSWANTVLVVDSGSNDETINIVARYPNTRVIERPFDNFANQCNYGLSRIHTDWVLSLDADYIITPELESELLTLLDDGTAAFEANFTYCIFGQPLRSTLYPPRRVLYRRERGRYVNEGHGHRVVIDGPTRRLTGTILHDDRKSLSRWFHSQMRYAQHEADFLLNANREMLRRTDRIRLLAWPAPILVFLYTLFWKGCILDGWHGWFYALQRSTAETIIALEIISRKIIAKLS